MPPHHARVVRPAATGARSAAIGGRISGSSLAPRHAGFAPLCRVARAMPGPVRGTISVRGSLSAGDEGRGDALPPALDWLRKASLSSAAALCVSAVGMGAGVGIALAETDTAAVGGCLLQSCQKALAGCLVDPTCVQNLLCVQTCQGRPDESACQIRCGDIYQSKAVTEFDTCALTQAKCVPKVEDDGSYPPPPDDAVDKTFDSAKFTGRWYITAGLNPLFDAFDCQEHFFISPKPDTTYGMINYRVKSDDEGHFIERTVFQTFLQNKEKPGQLKLDGSQDFLGFVDDWYILGSQFEGKSSDYIMVYYRGNNDAWSGYGGATLYTRSDKVPQEIVPQIKDELVAAGLDWDKFIITDNTCGPQPPSRVEKLEKTLENDVVGLERAIEKKVVGLEKSFDVIGMERKLESSISKNYGALRELQLKLEQSLGLREGPNNPIELQRIREREMERTRAELQLRALKDRQQGPP